MGSAPGNSRAGQPDGPVAQKKYRSAEARKGGGE